MQNLLNPPLIFFAETLKLSNDFGSLSFFDFGRPNDFGLPCDVQLVNLRPLRVGEILLQFRRTNFDAKFETPLVDKFCDHSTKFQERILNFMQSFQRNETSVFEIIRTDLAGIRRFETFKSFELKNAKEVLNSLNFTKIESFLFKFA